MKHYFFVNPAAGQGVSFDIMFEEIKRACDELGVEHEIYMTKGVGDGERRARQIAEALAAEEKPGRIYACGGDGTLNEVICGVTGFYEQLERGERGGACPGRSDSGQGHSLQSGSGAPVPRQNRLSVGCIPIGTGNDMVRNFPGAGDFRSVKGQLLGRPVDIDLIWYAGVMDGIYQERYCANMFNIGFDCNVVELAGRLKKKPFIAGSAAYLLAVLGVFLQKKTIGLHLEEDGEILLDDDVLLCSIANGSFCGGGIHTSPQSDVADGVFDLNIVNDVTRLAFLKLFPKYKAGTHLSIPGIEKTIRIKKCRRLTLSPKAESFFLCADGEICVAQSIDFEIRPKALSFILPAEV